LGAGIADNPDAAAQAWGVKESSSGVTMGTQQMIHAAVLHGIGQTPRYEPFPAPVAGDGEAVLTVTAAALKPSDRWMADGIHYAPTEFPHVMGLDGVGRLSDGTRVAFFAPQPPYGGMAEQALVRHGMWLPVPDGVDDVTAAAITNPGMAAWKTLLWEGELAAGQTVLVLGATGTSGRIATQLARRHGARVVAAGRNQEVLVHLLARGADATIRVDCPREELAAAIAAEGPFYLIVDYLWGPPAEAVFAALARPELRAGDGPERIRYIQVGIAAGQVAALPAITLRAAPVQLFGSGIGGPAGLTDAAAAYRDLLQLVAAAEISVDIDPVPLAKVEQAWPEAGSDRRIVFVP
jgi:NADPH:quinone reductase-like Zn-dependent oxidoreductase